MHIIGVSIALNWILGPAMMFGLAWFFLADLPHYRTRLVIVGLARCIAMVLIWDMLAGGDSEYCAVLVALNSLFQIVMYSPLACFYLTLVPQWFGADTASVGVTMWDIAKSVLIFLGIPLAAGVITRFTLARRQGREWYETHFFELAIAVAVGAFTIQSGEAPATVVGPLIEVPVLIGLVYVALWARRFFFDEAESALARPTPGTAKGTGTAPSKEIFLPNGSGSSGSDGPEVDRSTHFRSRGNE